MNVTEVWIKQDRNDYTYITIISIHLNKILYFIIYTNLT